MRISYIELSGFRGFRNRQRIDFGAGFTVISGRNGVGKSTLCDAIEFVLTGEIDKYPVESAARETVRDYIWWRGIGAPPSAHYVTAAFVADDGNEFIITRSRESGCNRSDAEILHALCHGAVPDEPLQRLAKTSIIRDEWIAALSLDLSETKRFDLVRAALGAIEGSDLTDKAKAVVAAAEMHFKACDARYGDARSRLAIAIADHSSATETTTDGAEVSAALTVLRTLVETDAEEELGVLLNRVRRDLPARRQRIDAMGDAAFFAHETIAAQAEYQAGPAVQRRKAIADRKEAADQREAQAAIDVASAARAHDIEARADEVAKSLALLVEHGKRIGLYDGHCPLCASPQSEEHFEDGIAAAMSRIDDLSAGMNVATAALNAARSQAAEASAEREQAQVQWAMMVEEARVMRAREEDAHDRFLRLEMPMGLMNDLDALDRFVVQQRNQMVEIERAIGMLDASHTVSQLASFEARVATCRIDADRAGDDLALAETALATAKSLEKNVKRSASEIVDERLALISPLLNELYQRLRPHSDWRNIEYSIRGDVKRFLSLKVGDDLNPQFVFSSGQRRAAGLAFLLSVHLARSWSRWSTLVLDDPVQHIDDFRALHLVEVLAAIGQGGRQIICAVEDEALADLLCRRLVSSGEQKGRRIVIDIDGVSSGDVVTQVDIAPLPARTLTTAAQSLKAI